MTAFTPSPAPPGDASITPYGRQRIAVLGSGIAGMSCAWLLSANHDVTVLERNDRIGGHSNTVDVPDLAGTGMTPVDTGFIVYNTVNYPNLVSLFDHLSVPTEASDMSFAVSLDKGRLEYSGCGFDGLFAQRTNALSPRFWRMTYDVLRFFRQAERVIGDAQAEAEPLGDFLRRNGYSKAFAQDHLLPMGAAIWSTPTETMEAYPTGAFVRFFANHGLLKLKDRPVWRTVSGGSRSYVQRLTAAYRDRIQLSNGAAAVTRTADGVRVRDLSGQDHHFDHVVIATHADEALALLSDPTEDEKRLLGAFGYQANEAWLHGDVQQMPRRRKAWASWNYLGQISTDEGRSVAVTYWMNRLQNLTEAAPLFVTLNPYEEPDPKQVYRRFSYHHPVFDGAAVAARKQLWSLQGVRRTWFCGSYFGDGFHEDGAQSGLAVAEDLGGVPRPWSVPGQDNRIARTTLPHSVQALLNTGVSADRAPAPEAAE